MMKNTIIALALLNIISNLYADEVVSLKSGKQVLLKDSGTWTYVDTSNNKPKLGYKNIDYIDLKIDIKSLQGAKIKTKGSAQLFTDMLMLKGNNMDMNPIFIDYKSVSRGEKKHIFESCAIGCPVTVYGEVGVVLYQTGIIAEKIEW